MAYASPSSTAAAGATAGPAASPFPSPALPPPLPRSSRRFPPPCWSHEDTLALIDAYGDKWQSLGRGNLRASHWDEVAAAVAHECPSSSAVPKTSVQCRHKIEKLRKRYRSERLRPVHSLWPFFDRIDRMERGPLLISARPTLPAPASSSSCSDFKSPLSNKRSVNGILGEVVLRGSARSSRNARPAKRLADVEDAEDNDEENEEEADEGGDGGRGGLTELAAELRRFGEGFVRMERKRIEMMREKEREWMEMESRRLEMVMEAQRGLVETIAGAFWKKTKNSEDL